MLTENCADRKRYSHARVFAILLMVALPCLCTAAPEVDDEPAPMQILKNALSARDDISDYTARVTVNADIPDMDIPRRSAKVYVKRPDRVYVQAKGIVLIPKRALLFGGISKDIEQGNAARLIGTKKQHGHTIYCIKLMPTEDPEDVEPGTGPDRILIWINGDNWTITRLKVFDHQKLLVHVQFQYRKVQGYWMPTLVNAELHRLKGGVDGRGSFRMEFNDYRINVGLTDEFMDKKAGNGNNNEPIRPRKRHRW